MPPAADIKEVVYQIVVVRVGRSQVNITCINNEQGRVVVVQEKLAVGLV